MSNQFDPNSIGWVLVQRTITITQSGFFYPTQAMLDAGGVLDLDGSGGGGGYGFASENGGCGGDSRHITKYQLTSLDRIPLTIGAGGSGNLTANGSAGGNTTFGTLTIPGGGPGVSTLGPGYGGGNCGRAGQPTFFTSNSTFTTASKISGNFNGSDYGQGGGVSSVNGIQGCIRLTWWERLQ